MRAIGILGGTFDPVHCGHMRLALEMHEGLGLDAVRMMPAPKPRLRDSPSASPQIRLRMLEAAVLGIPELEVDARELDRSGPTSTVETLRGLRREMPERPLCLLLGMDAFRRLDRWREWTALTELAHIGVAHRPGASTPESGAVAELLERRGVGDPARIHERPAGSVIVRAIPSMEISATDIRSRIASGRNVHCLVPGAVSEVIERSRLYTT